VYGYKFNATAECKKPRKGKKGYKYSKIKNLMEKTMIQRSMWIFNDKPLVSEVIEKFPFLTSFKWVCSATKYVLCMHFFIDTT